MRREVFVTFQKEGLHKYPAAGTDPNLSDVSFLQYPHRHIFHFKVTVQVFHDDRDIEFILLKRQCEKWLGEGYLELDFKSCEMISDELYQLLVDEYGDNRYYTIEVSEDNENGSVTYYESK